MVGKGEGWQLVDTEDFETAVANFGSPKYLDAVLTTLEYALSRDPFAWPIVPGSTDIRIAKTKIQIRQSEVIPAFNLWFRIDQTKREVLKLWVEIAKPSEIGLWDDDEIPF